MSLDTWKTNGWLREYSPSTQEVTNLLTLVERDLGDAARQEISADWRFNIAYNAGLQLATLVLYAAGYRTGRGESKHYRVIQTLPLVMGNDFTVVRDYLDNCRRKRNVSEYDTVGTVSEKEVNDLLALVLNFKNQVEEWLKENYPDLIPGI
jgi:uncharacterized protein (UPF0332 family)